MAAMAVDQPTFSLCAIFRNEERRMAEFLRRHRDLFDEMVLVDTGSSDRGAAIARDLGFPIHSFAWNDDFSAARNHSLSLASKDFVVVLDLDEILTRPDFSVLKNLAAAGTYAAFSLRLVNFSNDVTLSGWRNARLLPDEFRCTAAGYCETRLIRAFRNHCGIYYRKIVHETAGDSIRALGLNSQLTEIPVYHFGWLEEESGGGKRSWYRELIHKLWQAERSPASAYYYLTSIEDAQQQLRLAYRLLREYPQVKELWEFVARLALRREEWRRGLAYAERGLACHPGSEVLAGVRAACLNRLGRAQEALTELDGLLIVNPEQPLYLLERMRALLLLGKEAEARLFLAEKSDMLPRATVSQLTQLLNQGREGL